MRRAYRLLDVFTETPLAGNRSLSCSTPTVSTKRGCKRRGRIQFARDLFVFRAARSRNTAALRIFTPARELPFAGHPTVGAAALIAHLRAPQMLAAQDLRLVLEERVGDVVCVARHRRGHALAASFALPRLPQEGGPAPAAEEIAARLGLASAEIGFGAHRPIVDGAGVDFVFAPLASAEALARADPDVGRWGADNGPAVFCYTPGGDGVDYRARMFASGWGIREDPATGSAAAAFAGVVMRFAPPGDGERTLVIAQGVEMGRPSRIALGLEVERGALGAATIGGPAVLVAEGTIDL